MRGVDSGKLKYGAASYSVHFDTWEARCDAAAVPHSTDREGGHSDSWSGGSYSGAIKLMREGWKAGREQFVTGMSDAMNTATYDARKRTEWHRDVAGSRPCVPALLTGQPRSMYRARRQSQSRPMMTVCVNFVASASVTTEEFTNRGIAIASWIDQAEASGTRVEVRLCYLASPMEITCVLKRAEDPLDADRLAFALAHPAMLRRIGFGLISRDRKLDAHYSSSKGWCCNYTDLPAGTVYFPYLIDTTFYRTRATAIKHVSGLCNQARERFAQEGALV